MSRPHPDSVRASISAVSDRGRVETLLAVYAGALEELRSWQDPSLEGLVSSLETLQERALARRRELLEEESVAALLERR